jgi:hypothetical protein
LIQISRTLVRTLRSVLRRAARRTERVRPIVQFQADSDGLRLRTHLTSVAVEYHVPGSYLAEHVLLPLDALADFEGRGDAIVSIDRTERGKARAQWQDGVVPQVKEYDGEDPAKLPQWPALPIAMTPQDPSLWKALADAAQSAGTEAVRYALTDIQLRGRSGEIVATDGRQLLIQSGYPFPWQEDLRIPATPLFACKELASEDPLSLGHTDAYLTLQLGPWTMHLYFDKEGRYPKVDDVLPSPSATLTHWRIDPADSAFLAKALPRLPGAQDEHAPITVDLNGQALLRARDAEQNRTTELVLARSSADRPVRFVVNRNFVARALELGLTEAHIVNADSVFLFQDARRKFVVMPLSKDTAVPASKDALRIQSTDVETVSPTSVPERNKPMAKNPTSSTTTNGNGTAHRPDTPPNNGESHGGYSALIAEAEALKALLRDVYARANGLLLSIKRQRKQAHAVQATLANLRQLQHIDG